MCRPDAGDPLGALDRGRREGRHEQAAVGGEGLLRREVVDVGLGQVDRQPAGSRGGVDEDQRALVAAGGPLDRGHHRGGRLVVRPRVGVDAGLGDRRRQRAGLAPDDARLVEPGRRRDGGRELRGELPEGQVLALALDQPEGRHVPERRGAAVAQHDLVAVGEREQLGQSRADPAHDVADRRLAVRGAHQARPGRREGVEVARLDLGGTCAEPAVRGLEVGRDLQVGHGAIVSARHIPSDEESSARTAHRARALRASGRAAAHRGGPGGVRRPLRRPGRDAARPGDVRPARGQLLRGLPGDPRTAWTCRWPPAPGGCAPTSRRSARGVPPRASGCTSSGRRAAPATRAPCSPTWSAPRRRPARR